MVILGVESTAHTFGVGIVNKNGDVLANVKSSYSSNESGMVPDEVVIHHGNVAQNILKKALKDAKVTWDDVDFIAYSAGPGIDPCLWFGYHQVKEWAEKYGKKIVGVNHCCAHLSIGKIVNKLKNPCYLYVSGVNTQIIVYEGGKYRIIGETLDIGLGNLFDKFGRKAGLGFPAGPKIEKLAKKGKYVELPYAVKGMDVSFSGILTKATQLLERKTTYKELLKKQNKNECSYVFNSSTGKMSKQIHYKVSDGVITKEDLSFSIQETCFAMLAEVVERAMAHTGKKELLLVGGVGANMRFCEMLDIMCKERGAKFFKVPMDLAGDQGAMIAWEGFLRQKEYGDVKAIPHWRADQV